MSSERERAGYRERLDVGQVVYLVEGENAYSPNEGEPVTKKATVREDCSNRRYAVIQRWDSADHEPHEYGLTTTMSPRSLFTTGEVQRTLNQRPEVAHLAARAIDELLLDPTANKELAVALGGAEITRLADDLVRRPYDPEY